MKQRSREFFLHVLALLAKSSLLVPVFCFLCAQYDQRPGSRGAFGLVLLWGMLAAVLGLLLRGRVETQRELPESAAGSGRWAVRLYCALSVLLAGGLIWANFFVLTGMLGEPTMAFCGLIGIAAMGFFGWQAGAQPTVEVFAPVYQFVALALNLLCVAVVAMETFFNTRDMLISGFHMPLDLPLMVGVLAGMALISVFVMTVGSVDFTAANTQAISERSVASVRKYNTRAAVVLMVLVLVVGLLGYGGIYWLTDRGLSLAGEGVTAALTAVVNSRRTGSAEQSETEQAAAPDAEEEGGELKEATLSQTTFLVLIVLVLLALVFRSAIGAMFDSIADALRSRRGRRREMYQERFFTEEVEDVSLAETREIFLRTVRDPLSVALRAYVRLTEPEARVRRALPILRLYADRRKQNVQPGDTVRETSRLCADVLDAAALRTYADSYERVRYAGESARPEEAENAAALVRAVRAH